MSFQNLIESLKRHRDAIGEERVEKIDFDQLEKDLGEAVSALGSLMEKGKLCEKLLSEFKSEIWKMASAVSRAKGDSSSCSFVEKLLSSPAMSFEELVFLRERVREEFNQSFPSSPQSKATGIQPESSFRISEFKAGVRTQPGTSRIT